MERGRFFIGRQYRARKGVSTVAKDVFAFVEEFLRRATKITFPNAPGIMNGGWISTEEKSNASIQVGDDLAVQPVFRFTIEIELAIFHRLLRQNNCRSVQE